MRAKNKAQKTLLFTLLAVTRFLHRADFNVPLRWYSLIDSLRVSSGILHQRIGFVDEEVSEEFQRMEKQFDRRIGKEKFYDEEEIDELREKIKQVQV